MKGLTFFLILWAFFQGGCGNVAAETQPTTKSGLAKADQDSDAEITKLWNDLNKAVTEQRETDALSLAIQLLHAVPVQDAIKSYVSGGNTFYYDHEQQRDAALRAIKTFGALDEYTRKVKAYYKEDTSNATYDELMAEVAALNDPAATTGFLELAHKADPDNTLVVSELASAYQADGRTQDLYALVDPVLASGKPVRGGLNVNLIKLYTDTHQLPRLVRFVTQNRNHAPGNPLNSFSFSDQALQQALASQHLNGDAVALAQAQIDAAAPQATFEPRLKLVKLLLNTGDTDAFGKALADLLFPAQPKPNTARNYWLENSWSGDDIPDGDLLDLVRKAVECGQLQHLKEAGKTYLASHPDDLGAQEAFASILVVGHDPEALAFLPTLFAHLLATPDTRGGMPYDPIYALFGELRQWPGGSSLLTPTLNAAHQVENSAQPQNSFYTDLKVARLALQIPDQAMAQDVLRHAAAMLTTPAPSPPARLPAGTSPPAPASGNHPAPGGPALNIPPLQLNPSFFQTRRLSPFPQPLGPGVPPSRQNFNFEDVTALAGLLILAHLPDQATSLVGLISDNSKTAQARFPDSRSEMIASLGEQALDAGFTPLAKICAQAALQKLEDDWQNPHQAINGYYSVTIGPQAMHLTADLLARLGLTPQLADLAALLKQPPAAGIQIDITSMLADVDRLQGMFANPPRGLVPAVWIDNSGSGQALDRQVAWDLTARVPENGAQQNGSPFSVAARDLPQLGGKLALQILAGPTVDDLRIVQTVSSAASRGTVGVTLQATDQFIRAVGQTLEAQPHVFVGPIVPISLGPNLWMGTFREDRFGFDIYSPHVGESAPASSLSTVSPISRPGGPVAKGSYDEVVCQTNCARLELTRAPQPLTPGTAYTISGMVRGAGQMGIRYLDGDGRKISDSSIYFQSPGNEWHFVQQRIEAVFPGRRIYDPPPANATAFEPILTLMQSNTLDFQGLYLGITEQTPPPLHPDHLEIMKGLKGAKEIEESSEGSLLAAAFQNGDVRCFNLATHQEVGSAAHLPGEPVDIAFLDQGNVIVAADKAGDVIERDTEEAPAGSLQPIQQSRIPHAKFSYRAPWPIDFLSASSHAELIAIGNSEKAQVIVLDATTGEELARITMPSPPLTTLIVAPDGRYLFCRFANRTGAIWDCLSGQQLPITTPPLATPWIHVLALAHFFNIPHTLKINEMARPWWLQVQSDFLVGSDGSSITYSMLYSQNELHKFATGPISAFCLSTQSNDTYAVDAQGTLTAWKLPDDLKIPPFNAPPEIKVVTSPPPLVPGPPVNTRPFLPVAGHPLWIKIPDKLRGFPGTTLSQPLELSVVQGNGTPAPDLDLDIRCDLPGAGLAIAGPHPAKQRTSLHARTDEVGKVSLLVTLGKTPGQGTITVRAAGKKDAQTPTIPIESIDENAPLMMPHDITVSPSSDAMYVNWLDEPDNRTAFIIQRQVDGGPWRTIALVPGDATSYTDLDISYYHRYSYNIASTNESKYGYPPKLPPPPDRLGNFLP